MCARPGGLPTPQTHTHTHTQMHTQMLTRAASGARQLGARKRGSGEAGTKQERLRQGQRHLWAPGQGWRRGRRGVCEPGVCLAVWPTDSGPGPREPAPTSNSSAGDRCPSLPRRAAEGRARAAGRQADKPPASKGRGRRTSRLDPGWHA